MNRNLQRWLVSRRVRLFVDAVDRSIVPALAEFDFTLEGSSQTKRLFAACVFGCGSRYVKLTINLHPRDLPNYCNVQLGEGQRTWPENDWNGVALWALARTHPAGSPEATEYVLTSSVDVRHIVDCMRSDILTYAADFLRGDLTAFRAARASVNRDRPPYFIDGRIDPESDALKERFSS
jgi:hypothetical protein